MDNFIQVKLGKLGARTAEYTLTDGATVQDLVTAAKADGFDAAGYTPRVNNEVATLTTTVYDGDIVTFIAAVKGG